MSSKDDALGVTPLAQAILGLRRGAPVAPGAGGSAPASEPPSATGAPRGGPIRRLSRLDELTALGHVDVIGAPVVPACYGWPVCCVCGCVTPQATATAGLGRNEWLCPDCSSHLKAWAANRIMRAVVQEREEAARVAAEAAERAARSLERANACTCGDEMGLRPAETPLCDVCRAWADTLTAQYTAQRRRL